MIPLIRLIPVVLAFVGQSDPEGAGSTFSRSLPGGEVCRGDREFRRQDDGGHSRRQAVGGLEGAHQATRHDQVDGAARTDRVGASTRVKIRCEFETMPLDALVSFNKDKKAADAVTIEEEVVADALATAAKARSLRGIDPGRIFVLGHSEGGALAPLIARRDGHLAGVILLAASNRPPDELIRDQLGYIKTLDPSKAEEVGKMQKDIEAGLERVRVGKAGDDERIVGTSPCFWKSWQGIESARIAGELKGVPFLVLQGGRDYQVTRVDYNAFHAALRGRPNTAFHLYPDLNHLFQKGKGKAVPTEYLKPAFVDQRVVEDIAKWVKSLRGS